MGKTSWMEKWKREPKYATRFKNRCHLCGRSRSYIRRFGVCRICFRNLAHTGQLPGVTKSSW